MQLNELDIVEIRKLLKQLKEAFQEDLTQSSDYPAEVSELVETIDRLEKELKNKKSQEIISDFLYVLSFIEVMSEGEDEEFDEDEDEEFDEDEENDEETEED